MKESILVLDPTKNGVVRLCASIEEATGFVQEQGIKAEIYQKIGESEFTIKMNGSENIFIPYKSTRLELDRLPQTDKEVIEPNKITSDDSLFPHRKGQIVDGMELWPDNHLQHHCKHWRGCTQLLIEDYNNGLRGPVLARTYGRTLKAVYDELVKNHKKLTKKYSLNRQIFGTKGLDKAERERMLKAKYPKHRDEWTIEDSRNAYSMYIRGESVSRMCNVLQRSPGGIFVKLKEDYKFDVGELKEYFNPLMNYLNE